MSTRTVVSNEHYSLLFHEGEKIIHHIYQDKMGDTQLKELLLAGTELMKKHGAKKWISDNRQLKIAFNQENADWVNNVWLPATVAAGWKYWAMVVPENLISQADHMQYVESFYDTGIWVTVHSTVESAMEWITTVDKK